MPTIYKIDYPNADRPIRQEVEQVGYPHLDADGKTQYDNTHFTDEGKAWRALVREIEASVSIRGRRIARLEEEIRQLHEQLLTETALLLNVREGADEYFSSLAHTPK